ncbi:hypothetical protein B7Y94_04770 [Candidatus Saccharibacteria bacterium 32-49-12]|nr:MAG: hypothetical protein B7Y94_04770 [Candidatus Saccharibacteria bacterium 32-49-12]
MNPESNTDSHPQTEPLSTLAPEPNQEPGTQPPHQPDEATFDPTPQPRTAEQTPPPASDAHDPKSRLAMMTLAFFAGPTGLARIYIGDKSGIGRLWAYIISSILMIVPLINFISAFALLALGIWGVVDFFALKGRQTDAFEKPLHTTTRDDRYIKYLQILFIVALAFAAMALLATFAAMLYFAPSGVYEMDLRDFSNSDPLDSSRYLGI